MSHIVLLRIEEIQVMIQSKVMVIRENDRCLKDVSDMFLNRSPLHCRTLPPAAYISESSDGNPEKKGKGGLGEGTDLSRRQGSAAVGEWGSGSASLQALALRAC